MPPNNGAAKVGFFCNFSVCSKMEGTVFYVGIRTFVHKVPKPLYQLGPNHTTMTWLSQKPPQSGSHFHLIYIYKVFKNLLVQWMVIWMYPYLIKDMKVG